MPSSQGSQSIGERVNIVSEREDISSILRQVGNVQKMHSTLLKKGLRATLRHFQLSLEDKFQIDAFTTTYCLIESIKTIRNDHYQDLGHLIFPPFLSKSAVNSNDPNFYSLFVF